MTKQEEILFRLQLLLSDQIQNLQKYKSINNNKIYLDAYIEVMKLISTLSEIPDIKLVCHEGKFWKSRDIDKKYYRNRYDFLIDLNLNKKYENRSNYCKTSTYS